MEKIIEKIDIKSFIINLLYTIPQYITAPITMVKQCNNNSYPEENNEKYKEHFETFPFPLSDFQKHAIEGIVDGHHSLVCCPTGSGKTLPAEFAINYFTQKGKRVIYTSPLKALSNEKFYDFTKKYPHISFIIFDNLYKFRSPGFVCHFKSN